VRLVDFMPVFYGIGLVVLFAQGKGKRLGDIAAGTVVVKDRGRVRLTDLARRAAADITPGSGQPHPEAAAVGKLSPAMRSFVQAYRARRATLERGHREYLAQSVAGQLQALMPADLAADGALAALDRLADALNT